MNIPDEAVEAAMKAFDPSWATAPGDWRNYFMRQARLALEAAAPHMCRDAIGEHRGRAA